MSSDRTRTGRVRPRPLEAPALPAGPLRSLKAAIYDLYLRAETPTLDEIEAEIDTLALELVSLLRSSTIDQDQAEAEADALVGAAPRRDTISRIIASPRIPPNQSDVVAVAVALTRLAGGVPGPDVRKSVTALVEQIRRLWLAARSAPPLPRLGKLIRDCTPLALEVHRAIEVPGRGGGLPVLPPYVPRAHDALVESVIAAATAGTSRMVTLVGASSTGKTRACWESIGRLSSQWRLWHPIDPSRPAAAAEALDEVGPYTVVWLNEAQHYLLTADPALGERISAKLRTLLDDADRAPTLVMATMWPQYWARLTTRPGADDQDPFAQARDLLSGTDIAVPDSFTSIDMQALAEKADNDPRMRHAAKHADNGRITQHLAGVPELLQRYRNAPPSARAVIHTAIDARRLGHPLAIPRTLLEQAAPGYLSEHDWQQAGDDWLEAALAHSATPCHGVPGPLTPIRSRVGEPTPGGQPHYRLADYLEQIGRNERAGVFPPAAFWLAIAATVTDPQILRTLGKQAEQRGRYHRATLLYRRAAEQGDISVLGDVVRLLEQAGDHLDAEALAVQAADCGDISALGRLARLREQAGDHTGAETLYGKAVDRGNVYALLRLALLREQAGDRCGAEAVAVQAAERGNISALLNLARLREQSGDHSGAEALYGQAVERGNTYALADLIRLREQAGDQSGADALAAQAADRGNVYALLRLALLREQAGDRCGAEAVAVQAAQRGNISALLNLARLREQSGDHSGAELLYRQAIEHDNASPLRHLAWLREQAGDDLGAEGLYRQAADRGDTSALRRLAWLREQSGDHPGAEALAVDAADRGNSTALRHLAWLREQAGDDLGAEGLYRQAADRGDAVALGHLAWLRKQAGDDLGAEGLYRQAADRGDTIALGHLARLRERAGDHGNAEALAMQAADRGDITALRHLARLRERAGDHPGAETLYRRAVNRGNIYVLGDLARLRGRTGDQAGMDRIRRLGLADDGSPSSGL
ncbi:tetratricopeptide repeat protein [Plantactinospora solaniradicis]|uniref:Tetratricopeptide repeat protein n=1 Tax=Plantactinospora solaniradicis TaxID=1723736 RepID=A0ABW1KS41_9ACTN